MAKPRAKTEQDEEEAGEDYEKSDYKNITIALPTPMLRQIAECAKDFSAVKFRKVTRAEVIRELLSFGLRSWLQKKSEDSAQSQPSLF